MIENRAAVLEQFLAPFQHVKAHVQVVANGRPLAVSWGMAEAGYDCTLAETVKLYGGYSVLGATRETIAMPTNMVAKVIGKSTWARLGVHLNVTEIDPGFGQGRKGGCHITIELSYMPRWRGVLHHWRHAIYPATLTIPAKAGIGCLQFVYLSSPASYSGKYADQGPQPVEAR